MVKIGRFLKLIRIILSIEANSPLKPTNVGFNSVNP